MSAKVLILGFDAANRDLLLDWADQGILPHLRDAMKQGLTGFVDSMPGFYVGTTWPSFATCVSPARHSRHYIEQIHPGSYQVVRQPKGEGILHEPFWAHLSRCGSKVAVLDVPHTKPLSSINGIQVVEWGAHDGDYQEMRASSPEVKQEILALFGPNPAPKSCDGKKTAEEFVDFRNRLMASAALRAELTKHVIGKSDWDFLVQVWTESHCAGHQCWHFHDQTHPRFDPTLAGVVGDPIRDIYTAIDQAISQVLAVVDQNTTVILLTGHGMGPKFDAQFFLNDILLRLGYAKPPQEEALARQEASLKRHRSIDDMLTSVWQRIPAPLKKLAQPMRRILRQWVEDRRPSRPQVIDAAASRCFTVKNNAVHGGIRINLRGREPQGLVRRGPEFDELCESLAADIMDIKNLETGEPIADRVFRTDSLYAGEYLDYLPDVLIEWNQRSPVVSIGSEKIGKLEGNDPYTRTGDHRKGGMFVALGPHIPVGKLQGSVRITDFGPTVAQLLGATLPPGEGTVISEIGGL